MRTEREIREMIIDYKIARKALIKRNNPDEKEYHDFINKQIYALNWVLNETR